MKRLIGLFLGCSLLALSSSVFAADPGGSITITSPSDGAVLQSDSGNKLDFNIHLSPNGNHVHIYVDEQNPIVFRDVGHCPCSINLPVLKTGKHTIVVKEATVSHAMTGVEGAVTVSVK